MLSCLLLAAVIHSINALSSLLVNNNFLPPLNTSLKMTEIDDLKYILVTILCTI